MTNTTEITADFLNQMVLQMVLAKMINRQLWGKSYLAIPRFLRGFPNQFWKLLKATIKQLQRDGILLTKMKKGESCVSLNPRRASEIYQQIVENENVNHRIPKRFTRST